MRRHEILTVGDFQNQRFRQAITLRTEFDFDMSDIERIREEMKTLIGNLAKLYETFTIAEKEAKKLLTDT